MRLGTPESHSLLKTQQQVSAIQGTLQEIQQKLNTIEGKVDNLTASLRTIDAGLAKLLAAHEERQKEKEMKEKAEQKDKENAEANTRQLVEAVRTIPTFLQHSGQSLQLAAIQVEKALRVTVPSAFPLSPSSAAPSAAPSAGLASSSSSS